MRRVVLVVLAACGGSHSSSVDGPIGDGDASAGADAAANDGPSGPDARPASHLAYFGYWRDALTGSAAEIADHANISLVDDAMGNIAITPIGSVNVCDDCDVGGLSTDQWNARKAQIEATESLYPCPPADCTQVFATKELPALLPVMKCIGRAITAGGDPSC